MSTDVHHTKWRRNISENFNRLSRAHERFRQTTDGRAMTYSEREREFTFAKNQYGSVSDEIKMRKAMTDKMPFSRRQHEHDTLAIFYVPQPRSAITTPNE